MTTQNDAGAAFVDRSAVGTKKNPTRTSAIHYEYIMNGFEISPNYIQNLVSRQKVGAIGGGGYGAYRFQENVQPLPMKRLYPHKHHRHEYFLFYSTDPQHPDDIGGTVEFWLGEGEDAEQFIITKPTVVVVPPGVLHLPEGFRGYHGLNAASVIFDAQLWSVMEVETLPPGFSTKELVPQKLDRPSKYAHLVTEQDVSYAAHLPAHMGKAQPIIHVDMRNNPDTTHHIETTLVYGDGIGWGCGDLVQYPGYQIRSLPHLHDVPETYVFMNTDPDYPEDLGGTVEFWLGEGDKAQKFTITKPTVLLVPPLTPHLPMWVKEVHTPFIMNAILDSAVWVVSYTDVFPPAFEHISDPPEARQMQFNLRWDREKCTYPECTVCIDQCQVSGIDLAQTPAVVGKPCIRCGQCAVLCPNDAITVELT
jgi:ferredoxin